MKMGLIIKGDRKVLNCSVKTCHKTFTGSPRCRLNNDEDFNRSKRISEDKLYSLSKEEVPVRLRDKARITNDTGRMRSSRIRDKCCDNDIPVSDSISSKSSSSASSFVSRCSKVSRSSSLVVVLLGFLLFLRYSI